MINARSTYYRTITLPSPACDEYTLNLYIYTGVAAGAPGTPTYSLTRTNYQSKTTTDEIEIGRLVKSYFDLNYTDVSTGSDYYSQNEGLQLWVKTDVQFDGGSKTDASTVIALYGYGYGNEGLNPQYPANGILLTNNIFKVSRNTLFTIPVYCSSSKAVVITSPNSTFTDSYNIASTTDSDDIVQLITIDTSTISDVENYITVSIDTNDIILLLDNDERYENTDLFFINKYGGQQTVSMRKERSENMTVSRESYERSYGQPSDGYHQNIDFNVNGSTRIRLNSGYVPEQNNLTFKELMLSDRVWMYYNSEVIPVNVKTASIDYKTRAIDKLINYEIEVSHAYNEINTI